jgi:putative ABC transport system permease protein
MTRLRIFLRRLLGLFLRRKLERELEEEIHLHLELQIEDNLRQGMSLDEAERAARRKFGGMAQAMETYRDQSRLRWVENLWQDVRYGARMLLKKPGFTMNAIVWLALGIGANTAIFSVANTVLLQPPPINDADRIVDVRSISPRDLKPRRFSYPDYLDLRRTTGAAADLFGMAVLAELALGEAGEGEVLSGLLVTGNYFSALGGKTVLGRTLMSEDDRIAAPAPVVVMSNRFWQRRYGAAPDIVGEKILLNGRVFTVVGVAEPSFIGVERRAPDVWLPILMYDQLTSENDRLTQQRLMLHVMGRLQPGVSLKQAEASFELAFSQLEQRQLRFEPDLHNKLHPVSLLSPEERRTLATAARVMLGAVTLALLIVCLNLAGLTLARMATRQREIAVRLSLVASRGRVLRQFFTESLLLAAVGGLAGLLLSRWVAQALSSLLDPGMAPRGIALDWRVLAYLLGISVFTAAVISLLPAWQTTRFDPITALKQEGAGFNQNAGRFPLRSMLVVGQFALSLVLLLGAGLFARTLIHMRTTGSGFETKNLAVVEFNFRSPGSPPLVDARKGNFRRELEERLAAMPMVKDIVWFSRLTLPEPIDNPRIYFRYGLDVKGRTIQVLPNGTIVHKRELTREADGKLSTREEAVNFAKHNEVSPNYFAVLGMPLLYGRTFTEQEAGDEAAVVIINEALQRRHWPGENPVGKSIWMNNGIKEIIGVAKENTLLNSGNEPYLYLPVSLQNGLLNLRVLVRSDAAPGAIGAMLQTAIQSLDPKLQIKIRRFSDILKDALRALWVGTSLASLVGVIALVLAVMGLYGVMAFLVVQRTHEIGVRMALGARSVDVVRLVLRQGLRLVIIGTAIGLLISAAVTHVLSAALFGISPTDPLTFGVITLLLVLVALLACWIPARRATKVDPLVALRCD